MIFFYLVDTQMRQQPAANQNVLTVPCTFDGFRINRAKKLTFADDHGDPLAVVSVFLMCVHPHFHRILYVAECFRQGVALFNDRPRNGSHERLLCNIMKLSQIL